MKKYRRLITLLSPKKLALTALCALTATVIIRFTLGADNPQLIIICGAISFILVYLNILSALIVSELYSYSDKSIKIWFCLLCCKKIEYPRFNYVVISNACYNNCSGRTGDILLQYKIKSSGKTQKITFPFITLHKSGYPMYKIKSGMNSRNLFFQDIPNIFCLGICWFDSLAELLEHTQAPVYVLEDVYLRFKGSFDQVFMKRANEYNRFYIVTDCDIGYKNYMDGDNK